MKRAIALIAVAGLTGCDLDLLDLDLDCGVTASRDDRIGAQNADVLFVDAGAGDLRITTRAGLNEVRIRGTACADDQRTLDRIRLYTDYSSGAVFVETDIPDLATARLDLEIEIPEWMGVDVVDGTGDIEIAGALAVLVDDGSGDIDIRDVQDDVRVYDGSGNIDVADVGGDVWVRDDTGHMTVRRIDGDFLVNRDGSGDIVAQAVRGSVVVSVDGSGSIDVDGVGGDFEVRIKDSGAIRHRNVSGAVRIP